MRIAIAGPPKTGKTTLASSLGLPVRHTDDVISLGWSAASEQVSRWFDEPSPWCIEGVAVLRALRKWRERHPSSPPPLDRLVLLWDPRVPHTRGQQTMAKGIATVYAELEHWLAPVLVDATAVGKVVTGGSPGDLPMPNDRSVGGGRPPVPLSCAKIDNSRSRKEKPAAKPPRVRGERKFSLAAPPEAAPETDARAGELAPIVTTAYLQAFERLGGVTGLVRWGRKNPSAFYRTLASLAPALGRHAKGHGLVVQVAQFGEQQGRVIDGTAEKAADDPDPA